MLSDNLKIRTRLVFALMGVSERVFEKQMWAVATMRYKKNPEQLKRVVRCFHSFDKIQKLSYSI